MDDSTSKIEETDQENLHTENALYESIVRKETQELKKQISEIDKNGKMEKNEKSVKKEKKEKKVVLAKLPEEITDKKYQDYILKRQKFIMDIQSEKYNGVVFSTEEERANKIFKKLIKNLKGQLSDSFYKEFTMENKSFIEKTNIYKILKKMPKGANLHLHVDTAFDPDWVK